MESIGTPGPPAAHPQAFLDETTDLDGVRYQRKRSITDYRRDPGEARILYICHRIDADGSHLINEEYVMKVKVQVPPRPASDDPDEPLPGPSEMTTAEWKALQKFTDNKTEGVPHLIASGCLTQSSNGPFPGGYVSYTIMTKMPGQDLMAMKFWSQTDDVKVEIRQAFLALLKYATVIISSDDQPLGKSLTVINRNVWRLNIAPYDCALRNIIWDSGTRRCSIVDFEHYHPAKDPINMHETEEMQRWGIVQRPPPSHWAIEWGLIKEPNAA